MTGAAQIAAWLRICAPLQRSNYLWRPPSSELATLLLMRRSVTTTSAFMHLQGISMATLGCQRKANVLMEKFMVQELEDPDAYAWWDRTWSLKSCHGRWSIVYGGYCGLVTNASTEREWREDKESCSPKATMGEYLGIRFNTIRSKGKEHKQRLVNKKTPN